MIEVIHFLLFGLVAALHPHCIMLSPLIGVACFLVMESRPDNRCSCCVGSSNSHSNGPTICYRRVASPFWRNEALRKDTNQ